MSKLDWVVCGIGGPCLIIWVIMTIKEVINAFPS